MNKLLYFIGRYITKIRWHNYIIPNRYWRLVLGKDFAGTYCGIPLYVDKNLQASK